jgi:acetyltransferase-like isoleucine patch superfamily enzyme
MTVTCREPKQRHLFIRRLAGLVRNIVLRLEYPAMRGNPLFFIDGGAVVDVGPDATISIGRGVSIQRDFTGYFAGRVDIGEGVYINRGVYLDARHDVRIGRHCLIAEGVSIHDADHEFGEVAGTGGPAHSRTFHSAPIRIGDNVWIGTKATILKGVTIGDNAVVAAHAVVTRDVPANTLVAGVPARLVKQWGRVPAMAGEADK